MEEFEGIMFDEGDFEVVDECEGEEDTPGESEKQMDDNNGEKPNDGSASSLKENTKGSLEESTQKISSGKVDDFAADVSMDAKKENAEDDEVIHLDASDVLVLDSKDELESDDPLCNDTKDADSVVEVLPPEHAWYEEKMTAKTSIFKERLTKLARVLELSYPSYKPWMDHSKTPLCHLDPLRHAHLDKPHTNRWKFICSRKPVQESTNKEEDSADGTVNKKLETVWRLGPADGSGVNTDNASQYPPFVMRVVKVFEEFIQDIEQQLQQSSEDESSPDQEASVDGNSSNDQKTATIQETTVDKASPAETSKDEQDAGIEEVKADDDFAEDGTNDEAGFVVDRNHNWLWLLVRSNSKDELMVFATGKKISDSTMQKLKHTFETGLGKDCNVKSLYCKSIAQKPGSTATSNITFLLGSEALDETVGGLKIQLAPKTNFWCNAGGAEQLGAAVGDLLSPLAKTTLVEVGCGLGLIGLMLAPKCKQVIGLDAPSEVEEAEMTSELNKIKNASFIMGQSSELMEKVTKILKSTRAAAIVNGNTKLGRDIEVMTALRKIPSLRRVVMITTLTKQSVRAILELTRPTDTNLGNPFMPVRAVLVDTLPTGPHFEVVIRMERMAIHKMEEPWFWNHVKFRAGLSPNEEPRKSSPPKPSGNKVTVQGKKTGIKSGVTAGGKNSPNANRRANNRSNRRKNMKRQKAATQAIVLGKVTGVVRNPPPNLVKNPMASAGKSGRNSQRSKRSHSPGKSNSSSKKNPKTNSSEKPAGESPASPDPLNPVKVAKSTKAPTTSPLKKNPLAKNSSGRGQRLSGAQKRKRHWAMIEAGRQGGQSSGEKRMRGNGNRGDLRGRLSDGGRMDPHLMQQVQEQQMLLSMAQQRLSGQGPMVDVDTAKQLQNMLNIVLEQTNKLQSQLPRSVWDRIAPPDNTGFSPPQNMPRDTAMFRDRFVQDIGPQDIVITTPNNEFGNQGPQPLFPGRPLDRAKIMPAGMSPMENQGRSNSGRGMMPERSQGRDNRKSGGGNHANDWNRQNQNRGNQGKSALPIPMEVARPPSPKRPLLSPPRVALSPPRRNYVPSFTQHDLRRPQSPPRRQNSPSRRQNLDPPRNPHSEIFQRRPAALQAGRQQSSELPRRGNSPARREQTSGRSSSPSRRFGDDWDINRAMQQTNWNQREQQQQRSTDRDVGEKRWNERSQNPPNWDNLPSSERFRRGIEGQSKDGTWMSGGGDVWNSKQISVKPVNKDQWVLGMDKPEWTRGGNVGPSGDFWNSRKDSFGGSNNRMDNYRDGNKADDLPEDAKDPWGDDAGGKSRWQQNEKASSSNRARDWSNNLGASTNWQNKGNSSMNSGKQMWPNASNQNSDDQRWMSMNEPPRNSMQSNNWQGNYGMNMRGQNYSGFSQQQRQNAFGSTFKDGR